MSTSAQPGPVVPADKKKGGFLSRIKTALKKVDGSRRLSFSSKTPLAATTSTKKPAAPTPTTIDPPKEEKDPAPINETQTSPDVPQLKKVIRAEIDSERARKLGERFKVSIDPQQFPSNKIQKEVYRIEKPIRMRIHRQCHRCDTIFGGNKICASCEHVRCKACPRFPTKKTETNSQESAGPVTITSTLDLEPDSYRGLMEEPVLTKPNPTPGRQPLVKKIPMQRVRRTCCECSALFAANSKVCRECSHGRCVDCPRDPAKKNKYPDGYPGDAPSKGTSISVKYSCHKCLKECVRCGHERCSSCSRAPIVKVEPQPDPEIVRRVEAKLAALNIDTPSAAD